MFRGVASAAVCTLFRQAFAEGRQGVHVHQSRSDARLLVNASSGWPNAVISSLAGVYLCIFRAWVGCKPRSPHRNLPRQLRPRGRDRDAVMLGSWFMSRVCCNCNRREHARRRKASHLRMVPNCSCRRSSTDMYLVPKPCYAHA
ncbi:hypothetical protein HDV64DRAFT_226386 [Trichoderma sp. TUCIM 5745]